ncbi:aminotransferase class V-fold PLP-dependent enzyme [Endozoicomonas arenosclerae]|uniref:aminotransferase class V-fold PLP-dependent enzyme n=1 Tax=Endozoicomonas arenosclerae TaxID=1633495 RepID=UPI000B12F6EF|nr:aminotransferase class V-fold PLP-dependent enzyme [Endozoicomonas arenosclerae]
MPEHRSSLMKALLLITLLFSVRTALALIISLPNESEFSSSKNFIPVEQEQFPELDLHTKPTLERKLDFNWPANPEGFGSTFFKTESRENSGTGTLDIYLVPSIIDESSDAKDPFSIEPFVNEASHQHCVADSCSSSTDATPLERMTVRNETYQSKTYPVYSASLSSVAFSEVNFQHPVAWKGGRQHCRINGVKPKSSCSTISSVVLHFRPDNPEQPEHLVVHILNRETLSTKEATIAEMEKFLKNDKNLRKMLDVVLEFRDAKVDDHKIKESGPMYLWGYTKWLYIRHWLYPGMTHYAPVYKEIPEEPEPLWKIRNIAYGFKKYEDGLWEDGTVSGSVYSGDHDNYDFLNEIFGMFSHANAIQKDLSPSAMYFESSVVNMMLEALGGNSIQDEGLGKPDGVITSGGSMSIKAALKAYRDRAIAMGIRNPEIIIPSTAHPAFKRGPVDLVIKVAKIHEETADASYTVDMEDVRRLINPEKTILLVGSAGNYPYGTIDPLTELSGLSQEYDIGLHVDACLGGFILAWLNQEKYPHVKPFDFRLPGVTSISVDTHKYGYSLKSNSVLLMRNRDLSDYLAFVDTEWKGGMYAVANLEGSMSTGLFAAPWAAMLKYGKKGYRLKAEQTYETAAQMVKVIKSYPELHVMGEHTMCLAFKSRANAFRVNHIKDFMGKKKPKWRFNGLNHPEALHFCVTGPQLDNEDFIERFEKDLSEAVAYAKDMTLQGKEPTKSNVYGVSGVDIALEETISKQAFAQAGGYLIRDTADKDELIRQFKVDMRRIVHKGLGMRRPKQKTYNPDEI